MIFDNETGVGFLNRPARWEAACHLQTRSKAAGKAGQPTALPCPHTCRVGACQVHVHGNVGCRTNTGAATPWSDCRQAYALAGTSPTYFRVLSIRREATFTHRGDCKTATIFDGIAEKLVPIFRFLCDAGYIQNADQSRRINCWAKAGRPPHPPNPPGRLALKAKRLRQQNPELPSRAWGFFFVPISRWSRWTKRQA